VLIARWRQVAKRAGLLVKQINALSQRVPSDEGREDPVLEQFRTIQAEMVKLEKLCWGQSHDRPRERPGVQE
jgi:hypothetical protein